VHHPAWWRQGVTPSGGLVVLSVVERGPKWLGVVVVEGEGRV
jgi:hypothetical protein